MSAFFLNSMSKSSLGQARLLRLQARSRIRLGLGRSLALTKDRHRAFRREYKIQIQKVPNTNVYTLYKAGCLPLKTCKPQICSRAPFPTHYNCFLPTSLHIMAKICCRKIANNCKWLMMFNILKVVMHTWDWSRPSQPVVVEFFSENIAKTYVLPGWVIYALFA